MTILGPRKRPRPDARERGRRILPIVSLAFLLAILFTAGVQAFACHHHHTAAAAERCLYCHVLVNPAGPPPAPAALLACLPADPGAPVRVVSSPAPAAPHVVTPPLRGPPQA